MAVARFLRHHPPAVVPGDRGPARRAEPAVLSAPGPLHGLLRLLGWAAVPGRRRGDLACRRWVGSAADRHATLAGLPFETALRGYLEAFRLPGEAQKINRILMAFAQAVLDPVWAHLPIPAAAPPWYQSSRHSRPLCTACAGGWPPACCQARCGCLLVCSRV